MMEIRSAGVLSLRFSVVAVACRDTHKEMLMAKQQTKMGKVMSILNMKGGVGKTTLTAHVFREFYKTHEKNVLLIDIDPQFNLTQTIFPEALYEKVKNARRTMLSVMESPEDVSLYSVHEQNGDVPQVDDVKFSMYSLKNGIRFDLIPGDFSLCKYSLMSDKSILDVAAARFAKFVEQAREHYDLICIDCNPSSSFLTVCALKSSTHLLVPVRPDRYSMLGLRMLDDFISGFRGLEAQLKKIIILNGIPTSKYDPTVENELRSDPTYGRITLAASMHMTRLLEASPTRTGFATDRKAPHSKALKDRIARINKELAVALGLK